MPREYKPCPDCGTRMQRTGMAMTGGDGRTGWSERQREYTCTNCHSRWLHDEQWTRDQLPAPPAQKET